MFFLRLITRTSILCILYVLKLMLICTRNRALFLSLFILYQCQIAKPGYSSVLKVHVILSFSVFSTVD